MEGYGRHSKIGKLFGIGIVGLGEGKGLVKGLDNHTELRIQAICDINEKLAKNIQHTYKIPFCFLNIIDLVKHKEIDIVVLYTPDQSHLEHIRMCFEADKHVICTKPLVNSLKEALEVLKLVDKYPHCKLMVGQSSRFFGPMQKLRKSYIAGKLGDLCFVESHYVHDMRWFYGNREWARKGGFDLLFGCCSHPVDLVRWMMGDVDEVHAYADKSLIGESANFHGNDIFVINLKFDNGKIGRILGFYGLEQPHQNRPWIELAAYGTEGTFIAKYPQLESLIKYKDKEERIETYFEDIYHYFQYEGINHHAGEFVNYTEYFARCLVNDELAMPDAYDGFKTIATLEAIRESIKSGKPIHVETFNSYQN